MFPATSFTVTVIVLLPVRSARSGLPMVSVTGHLSGFVPVPATLVPRVIELPFVPFVIVFEPTFTSSELIPFIPLPGLSVISNSYVFVSVLPMLLAFVYFVVLKSFSLRSATTGLSESIFTV